MVKPIAHLSAILFAAMLVAIGIGRILPRGAQILYTSSNNWWAQTWNVFVLDIQRDIAQRLFTSKADTLPGLSPIWSPDGVYIAFLNLSYDGVQTSYIVDAQGTQPRQISGDPTELEYNAAWSPDGRHLAFIGEYDGQQDVYLAAPDGDDVRRMTFGSPGYKSLTWSPNSCCLALESTGLDSDIYILNLHNGELRNLTDSPGSDLRPAWSPDNRTIAFMSSRESLYGSTRFDLYTIQADGSHLQRFTDAFPADSAWNANWSPDGRRILFGAGTWSGGRDIYLLDVQTGAVKNVTDDLTRDSSPVWSPDSSRFAFESQRDGHWQIYVMDADGTKRKAITNGRTDSRRPVWSPDGEHIVYTSNRDFNWDLYMTAVDAPAVWRITYNRAIDTSPLWRP